MIAIPFVIPAAHALTYRRRRGWPGQNEMEQAVEPQVNKAEGHVIIIGYGLNGEIGPCAA